MNKMELYIIEASNCLPICPIGDGGRSSLLISAIYWPRFWLMLDGRLLSRNHDVTTVLRLCGHIVKCEQGVLGDNGADSQCGHQGGCDSASLHCLDSDCQDEYFSLRGRCGAQNHWF